MLRKSTEMFNRRSITSSLAFRRKTASRDSGSSPTSRKEPISRGSAVDSVPDISRQLTPSDPVEITDIIDDVDDILDKQKPNINGVDKRAEPSVGRMQPAIIKAINVMNVQDFDRNSEQPTNEPA